MYQVWWVNRDGSEADFEKWFDSYKEAEAYADAHDSENKEYVVLGENEEFCFW